MFKCFCNSRMAMLAIIVGIVAAISSGHPHF
jgi:hypothetical protein